MNSVLTSVLTRIDFPWGYIVVTHEDSVPSAGSPENVVVVLQESKAPNVLTRIEIRTLAEKFQPVLLLWRRTSIVRGLAMLYSPATNVLFVGAETFVAAVRMGRGEVIDAHNVTLFWSFQQSGDYVIELGETDCFLRTATGEIVSQASVDPPYELLETEEGIRFDSLIMGTQWLRYPGRR